MAVLNICGFETGKSNVSGGSTSGEITGGGAVFDDVFQTSVVRTGEYAGRVHPIASNTCWYQLAGMAATGVSANINTVTLFVRFYFRIATMPSADCIFFTIAPTASTVSKMSWKLSTNGTISAHSGNSASTLVATGTKVLTTDTWYMMEMQLGTSATATVEWKVDGVVDVSTTDNRLTNCGDCYFGRTVSSAGGAIDFYYDDICIRDDAYPGPGKIVRLDPISDDLTWTTGTFAAVDDYATQAGDDTDTTFSTTSTNGDILRPAFTSMATAGVTGTVNAVKSVVVCRDENQTVSFFFSTRIAGTSSQATTADGGNSYGLRAKVNITRPSDGQPIAVTDTLEISCTHDQSQSRPLRCTAMAVMVDYIPANKSIFPGLRRRGTRFFRQNF